MNCYVSLPFLLGLAQLCPCHTDMTNSKMHEMRQPLQSHMRAKRTWVWHNFFVQEELTVPEQPVGRLRSNLDKGDASLIYLLSGDGAGSIFIIDNRTGDITAIKKLDREEKAYYKLRAQVLNVNTGKPVEPESEFVIKVLDINDNKPQFLDGPYETRIPEMSPEGTSVIQVTATDNDDPSYGNNARLIYTLLQGRPYFTVEPTTGILRISSQMDREAKDQYLVVVQATDMLGLPGGLSGTTTVTINLSDVNDNRPIFQLGLYHMNVSESAPVGTSIGIIMAEDSDIGENAKMNYSIEDGSHIFDIITNNETQEGIVVLKKKLDYEQQRQYSVRAKVTNSFIDEYFPKDENSGQTTIIKIRVEDADEPPVFSHLEYLMEVAEETPFGSYVGSVFARDPDVTNSPIRYSVVGCSLFSIDDNGTIVITERLDREMAAWYNLTVTATEENNLQQVSEAQVYVHVLNVNDHAPEFFQYYETYVCEKANPGELIQTISAVDKDASVEDHRFSFNLSTEATSNLSFTVRDNQDNTAGILTSRSGFSRQEQPVFYLPILISDNEIPSLTSTNTLTIHACECDENGGSQACTYGALTFSMGFSTEYLIAILTCILIILVFIFMILGLKQGQKQALFPDKCEEFRENIVTYDDEGGGEEDTEAFDIAALRTRTVMRTKKTRKNITTEIRSLYRQSLQVGPDSAVFKEFILAKLEEANTDPCAPPFDSLQTYAFEGTGSLAGSLSSLESSISDPDQNFDYLTELGPRFKKLASMYCSRVHTKN
ncbi:cadherin-19 isoform X1 [Sarcophilus harrisii]|uniref:Cadherin 19 n=1 Tax=Sarcophilus harrisii TaxID=9305 RepID=G3VSS8_SARHA|nr:cadherin-19 isoform X1 [Sarcophilus harrisii]XP_031802547.1 cadherin-19 isoform X1 [Sarcophilus harrisii]XP_031802548.1 cadherin-19 isoform X1 [Sarcophilus harrisii]XP_031802549.1 cadherin-19 isoform X1 [Sarcophilus harrisii]